jgi:uncharacterized Fe-S center protein
MRRLVLAVLLRSIDIGSALRSRINFLHSSLKSLIKLSKCVGFGIYVKTCAKHAIPLNEKKVVIDYKECVGSGQCTAVCQF